MIANKYTENLKSIKLLELWNGKEHWKQGEHEKQILKYYFLNIRKTVNSRIKIIKYIDLLNLENTVK